MSEQPAVLPEEEQEIEVIPESDPPYPWTDDPDEMRRCFVFETLGGMYDIGASDLIPTMQRCFEWLKDGKQPEPPARKGLKVVKPDI